MSGNTPKQSSDNHSYSQYLQGRSLIGGLYRKYLLYPKLCSFLEGHVLDYGCGIGDFIKFRPNTVGTDINEYNVGYCQSQGLDAQLTEGGVIPFPDNEFDGVVMDNVLEHIPEAQVASVINEMKRVLKPQGSMLVGVPGRKGYDSDSDHKVFYTDQDLTALFQKYGFEQRKLFFMPISGLNLGGSVRQFCIYAQFVRSK